MKVVLQTPTQLVVHDGVLRTVVMGTVFAVLGGGGIALWIADPTGWTGNGGPWLIYLVGGTFIIVGVVMFALSADRRYVIDLAANTVRFTAQRLAHRTTNDYSLSDMQDIALELSKGGATQSNPCYRIVFVTKSGTRVPWTPYWTNDQAAFAACASAVRVFCGWAGASAPAAVTISGTVSGHPIATNWGCMGAFLSIFVAAGLGVFGAEVYRFATWEPVSARVLTTDIKTVSGDKGSTYAPAVTYQYSFKGAQYTGDGVLPITISASHKWAENLRDRFRPGHIVTAYVNPSRPSKAYLVRRISLLPLLFVGMPIAMVLFLSWIVQGQRRQLAAVETMPVPVVQA